MTAIPISWLICAMERVDDANAVLLGENSELLWLIITTHRNRC